MVDLGGGSCELTISSQGHIRETVSLPLGAVRLTNEFLQHDPPRKAELRRARLCGTGNRADCRPHYPIAAKSRDCDFRDGQPPSPPCVMAFTRQKVRAQPGFHEHRCAALPNCYHASLWSSGLKQPGVGPRRAEIVTAGAVVYAELLERCQLAGFRYSPLGLRDGLLAQMAAEYDGSTRSGKHIQSERWDSIKAAVAHYRVDMSHALQVREAAMHLFKSLKSVHRLPPEYEEWLSAAAMLYEVGTTSIATDDTVTRITSWRIPILGYTPEQRRIIAAIARYLGKSRPVPGDGAMKVLPPPDREYVRKALLLLRLARALNLGRSGAVRGTRERITDAGGKSDFAGQTKGQR